MFPFSLCDCLKLLVTADFAFTTKGADLVFWPREAEPIYSLSALLLLGVGESTFLFLELAVWRTDGGVLGINRVSLSMLSSSKMPSWFSVSL